MPTAPDYRTWEDAALERLGVQRDDDPHTRALEAYFKARDPLPEPADPPASWSGNWLRVELMRDAALSAQVARSASHAAACAWETLTWVRFLLTAATEDPYLSAIRSRDSTFYDPHTLRPKPRAQWPEDWRAALSWLKNPETMTVLEFELALVLFEWCEPNSSRAVPSFAWWLQRFPHVLWQVERTTLRRYGWELLYLLQRARKQLRLHRKRTRAIITRGAAPAAGPPVPAHRVAADFELTAFRAWRLLHRHPRVHAVVLLGLLALLDIDAAQGFLFGARLDVVAGVALAAAVFTGLFSTLEVFRQNQGLLVSLRHAWPRIRRLAACLSGCGIVWSTAAVALLTISYPWSDALFRSFTSGSAFANLVLPDAPANGSEALRLALGTAALGCIAGLVGAMAQLIWQERSAAEPI